MEEGPSCAPQVLRGLFTSCVRGLGMPLFEQCLCVFLVDVSVCMAGRWQA